MNTYEKLLGLFGLRQGRRCLRCGRTVYTSAPTILCDGIISKVVPLSKHEPVPVIGADE